MDKRFTKKANKRKAGVAMVTSAHPDFDSRIWKEAKSLALSGFETHLVCPWKVRHLEVKDGVIFHPFRKPARRWQRILAHFSIFNKLLSLLKQVDLIHFHDLDLLPLMIFFPLRMPVVYDIHENYAEEMLLKPYLPTLWRPLIAWIVKWGEWLCVRMIKNLVVVVDSLEKIYAHPGTHVVKVRNFATLELENDYDHRIPAVIFTGSQYIANGSLLFLEVAHRVHLLRPNVKFYCTDRFGIHEDLQFKKYFLLKIVEYKLQNVVFFLPNVKPHLIMLHINQATIGLSPNLNLKKQKIALPTKIFEYMAGGIPIVASNLPYLAEFIDKNGAGLLADPDNPDQFAEKTIYLLDHKDEAKKMGEDGLRVFREKYCWEKEVGKLIQMYHKILNLKEYTPQIE
jgi:glycosyltransferase involved in cell wall biosynthesis